MAPPSVDGWLPSRASGEEDLVEHLSLRPWAFTWWTEPPVNPQTGLSVLSRDPFLLPSPSPDVQSPPPPPELTFNHLKCLAPNPDLALKASHMVATYG